MEFNQNELERIQTAIRIKLSQRMITYQKVHIVLKDSKLLFKFEGVKHPTMKNVRIMSYESSIKDTTMFCYVYIRLRFLHGNLTSPVIGMTLTNFRLTLQ